MNGLFKKPDLHVKQREDYLKNLEGQILNEERKLETVRLSAEETKRNLTEALQVSSKEIANQIEDIDNVLKLKRSERAELEKPIADRTKALDERADVLDTRAKEIDEKEQMVFERERANESKLEGLKDLADELGETRTRLLIKEKLVLGRESSLKLRETEYILAIQSMNERDTKFREMVKEREYALQLRELNVQGKDENLVKREKELSNGYLRLNDQRQTLKRAWDELEKKKLHV